MYRRVIRLRLHPHDDAHRTRYSRFVARARVLMYVLCTNRINLFFFEKSYSRCEVPMVICHVSRIVHRINFDHPCLYNLYYTLLLYIIIYRSKSFSHGFSAEAQLLMNDGVGSCTIVGGVASASFSEILQCKEWCRSLALNQATYLTRIIVVAAN